MMALTLRHPWPWAICQLGKRVENRTWRPHPNQLKIGERFAIHGGKWPLDDRGVPLGSSGSDYVDEIVDTVRELKEAGLCSDLSKITLRMLSAYVGIVAVATYGGAVSESANPWFVGPNGWQLNDIIVIPEPVKCRGAQGLWPLADDVEAQVMAQLRKEGAA